MRKQKDQGKNRWDSSKEVPKRILRSISRDTAYQYSIIVQKNQQNIIKKYGKEYLSFLEEITILDAMIVYNNRPKYDYAGFIYKIIEKSTGKIYYGLTTTTLKRRWYQHKYNPRASTAHTDSLDYYLFDLRVNQKLRSRQIDRLFRHEVIEICFSARELNQRERYWTNLNIQRNGPTRRSFNLVTGGGGIMVPISLNAIVYHLCQGLGPIPISKILKTTPTIIRNRITDLWGTFMRAREFTLIPTIIEMIKLGYDRKYIAHSIGGSQASGHDIISPELVSTILIDHHNCDDWNEVQNLHLLPILESLVKVGLNYEEMQSRLPGLTKAKIKLRLQQNFQDAGGKGLEAARRILIRPILENLLRAQVSDYDIMHQLGLRNWSPLRSINDPNRLLYFLTEQIFIKDYPSLASNYADRVIKYTMSPTDLMRYFFRTGRLPPRVNVQLNP